MIDARSDIDDLNKFIYLQGSLIGPASKKLLLYDASPENYKKGGICLPKYMRKNGFLCIIITPQFSTTNIAKLHLCQASPQLVYLN